MASRFAVATGTWNSANTAIWSATTGGAPGASAPTTADDVFLNAASGNITVTISGTVPCKSMDCTGFTGTLTGSGATVQFGVLNGNVGDCILSAGMTFSGGPQFFWQGGTGRTSNLTTNGQGLGAVTLQQAQTVSLQDDLQVQGAYSQTGSTTFTTNGHNVQFLNGASFNAASGTFNAGASTLRVSGGSWTMSALSSASFASSTIKLEVGATTFNGGGKTYGTVWFAQSSGSILIQGSNSYGLFKVTAGNSIQVTAGTTQTFSNFPQISGVYNGTKTAFTSSAAGSFWTFSKATGIVVCDYLSLKDSHAVGGAAWYANQSTNVSGNSGWTFGSAPEALPAVKGKLKKETGRGGAAQTLRLGNMRRLLSRRSLRRLTHPFQLSSTYNLSGLEAASATDSPSVSVKFVVSVPVAAAAAADVPTVAVTFTGSMAVAAAASDSPSVAAKFVVSASAAGAASDAPSSTASMGTSSSAAATAADAPSGQGVYLGSLADAAAASDDPSRRGTLVVSSSEAASAADVPSALAKLAVSVAAAGAASDGPSALARFSASTIEVGTAADGYSVFARFSAFVAEPAGAVDHGQAIDADAVTVSEKAAAADFQTAVVVTTVSIAEIAAAVDHPGASRTSSAGATEAATATDLATTSVGHVVSIHEVAVAFGSEVGRLVGNVRDVELAVAADYSSVAVEFGASDHEFGSATDFSTSRLHKFGIDAQPMDLIADRDSPSLIATRLRPLLEADRDAASLRITRPKREID